MLASVESHHVVRQAWGGSSREARNPSFRVKSSNFSTLATSQNFQKHCACIRKQRLGLSFWFHVIQSTHELLNHEAQLRLAATLGPGQEALPPSSFHPDLLPGRGHWVHWGASEVIPRAAALQQLPGGLCCHHVKCEVWRQVGRGFSFSGSSVSAPPPTGPKKSQACAPKGHPSQTSLARLRHWGLTPQRLPPRWASPGSSAGCSRGLRAAGPQAILPDRRSPGTGVGSQGHLRAHPRQPLARHPAFSRKPGGPRPWASLRAV